MKYYKNIAIGMVILVLILVAAFNLDSNADSSQPEVDKVDFAKQAISSYLKNQDLNETNDLSRYFDHSIKAYLDAKLGVFNYNNIINNIQKTNYDIEIILLDEIEEGEKTLLKFQVISSWNYKDDTDESSQSREIHILFDENLHSGKILDIYSPFDYFDEVERGEFLDILDRENAIDDKMNLNELELKYKNKIDNN